MFSLRVRISGILIIATALVALVPQSRSQDSPQEKPAISSYPETEEGLKSLLADIFAAIQSSNETRISSLMAGLALPDHAAWFTKTFGPEQGGSLEAKYAASSPEFSAETRKVFEYALKSQRTQPSIKKYEKTADGVNHAPYAVTVMISPAALYEAYGSSPNDKYGALLGDYMYVDGAFRFFNPQLWRALSGAPVMRVRVGGQVMASRLKIKIPPEYPKEARVERVAGTVRLRAVVARDGKIKEIQIVSGPPLLQKAALDACLKWVYEPTLLNGEPVEVETTIDVVFSLNY